MSASKHLSPCHSAGIDFSLGDGVMIGSCGVCQQDVCRVNPQTGQHEWLDGESPWSSRDDLRPMNDARAQGEGGRA